MCYRSATTDSTYDQVSLRSVLDREGSIRALVRIDTLVPRQCLCFVNPPFFSPVRNELVSFSSHSRNQDIFPNAVTHITFRSLLVFHPVTTFVNL